MSDKFAFSLFDLDWDVFMQHIEGAVNRVPALEQTGIKSTVCGPGTKPFSKFSCKISKMWINIGICLNKFYINTSSGHPVESFTADHKPLMGEAPEVRGYFLGCGFNSAGKMWRTCVLSTRGSQRLKELKSYISEKNNNIMIQTSWLSNGSPHVQVTGRELAWGNFKGKN